MSKSVTAAQRRAESREGALAYRSFELRSKTVDVEGRSVDATVSTESPVPMWDPVRWEVVPEVLRADGVKLPKQVPLLDSHSRGSMRNQLGSARDLRVEGENVVVGRLWFGEGTDHEFGLVRDGHADSVSAGYTVLKRVYVPEGATKTIGGRTYEGPVNVVTKWRLREVSLTPIGADELAKLRALRDGIESLDTEGGYRMDLKVRELFETRGMPKGLDDEAALKWVDDNTRGVDLPPKAKVEIDEARGDFERAIAEIAKRSGEEAAKAARKIIDEQRAAEAEHRSFAESLCKIAGREDLTEKAIACKTRAEIETLLTKAREDEGSKFPTGVSVRVMGEGADRFVEDLGSAMTGRALQNAGVAESTIDKVFPKEMRKSGAVSFRHATLYQMAEDFVRTIYRVDTRGMSRDEVAITALFGVRQAAEILGLDLRSEGGAYHTTGNFANLTMDAVNKSLSAGYTEAPATWRGPMRQGSSVPDFKEKNVIRMGAIPNLPIWQDNKNPEKASFADSKASYGVESRSLEIGLSYRTLVNDDMDALSRVPSQLGNAAARTVNAVAWSQVISNPVMSDGEVLFLAAPLNKRKQPNLLTNAGTPPSVAAMQALGYLIRTMTGEITPEGAKGPDVLSLRPKYLVVPASLETVANQLVNSAYDPASGVNTQVFNPTRTITPVVEPLLDLNSILAWYLFADSNQIDTVELSFLQGQESPVIRQWMDPRNLSQMWTVLQTFGAKVLNHRGIAKQKGEA